MGAESEPGEGDRSLGAFVLQALLARGGMGEVWRGVHRLTGVPVAIKVLRPDRSHRQELAASLEREAQALARLAHPHVVSLVDWGQVAADEAGELSAGDPYLVLEYVGGGDLSAHAGALGWSDVRRVVQAVLDGLAHAHARQIVHLDVKPANVLLLGGAKRLLHPKLTDFGIARVLSVASGQRRSAGTPGFMAPEQARGDWRAFGPWTDLVGVAGLVRFLLAPGAPAPAGLSGWLERMSAADPVGRFPFAADAARALADLGDPTEPSTEHLPPGAAETWFLEAPVVDVPAPSTVVAERTRIPAVPERWQRPRLPVPVLALPNVGRRCLHLRVSPVVGRVSERDAVWSGLVRAQSGPSMVLLEGCAGLGRTRLVDWMVGRARELGVAHTFVLKAGSGDSLVSALARGLSQWLRVQGLDVEAARIRACGVAEQFGIVEAQVVELVGDLGAWCARPSGTIPIDEVLVVLKAYAAVRPVLLALDDAHLLGTGPAALAELFRRQARVFVLASVSSDASAQDRAVTEGLLQSAGESGSRVVLQRLSVEELMQVLTDRVLVDHTTARRIAEWAEGSPAVALQMLMDANERDALIPTSAGLRLEAPLSSGDLEMGRVERAFAQLTPDRIQAVECAAVLGLEVELAEWAQAVELDDAADLVDRMVRTGLAERISEASWRFSSSAIREAVLSGARSAGRLAQHHAAVARVLMGHGSFGDAGMHLLEADEPLAALDALSQGVANSVRKARAPWVNEWVAAMYTAVERSGIEPGDARRALPILAQARHLFTMSDHAEALRKCQSLIELSERWGWKAVGAQAQWQMGRIALYQGQPDVARRRLEPALVVALEVGDTLTEGRCLVDLARVQLEIGNLEEAEALLRKGSRLVEAHDPQIAVLGWLLLGDLLLQTGRLDQAQEWVDRAVEVSADRRQGLDLSAQLMQAEVARKRGNLEAAEVAYRRIAATMSLSALQDAAVALLNLGIVHVLRGDHPQAVEATERALAGYRVSGRLNMEAACHAVLLHPLAALGDATAFERHLESAQLLLGQTQFRHPDIRTALVGGLEQARERGWESASRLEAVLEAYELPTERDGRRVPR